MFLFFNKKEQKSEPSQCFCGWRCTVYTLKPNSWHTLTLSSFCFCGTLSLYGLRGHIVCESAFAPTQKCQALLSSQPLNYFRSLPEGKGDRIYFTDMKQKALRSQTGGEQRKLKRSQNCNLNENMELTPACRNLQAPNTNIQEMDKITLVL